jgi:quercetin dioxygenase-like cupin family protein
LADSNSITDGHFTTEAEAFAEIENMGWHALARDVVIAKDEELHWHDCESAVFIVSGTLRAVDEYGVVSQAGAGSRVRAHAGTIHSAQPDAENLGEVGG